MKTVATIDRITVKKDKDGNQVACLMLSFSAESSDAIQEVIKYQIVQCEIVPVT